MNNDERRFMRGKAAASYLREKYGHGSPKTLAKLRVTGGGPLFHRVGRLIVYTPEALDAYAVAKISPPLHSTSAAA